MITIRAVIYGRDSAFIYAQCLEKDIEAKGQTITSLRRRLSSAIDRARREPTWDKLPRADDEFFDAWKRAPEHQRLIFTPEEQLTWNM